MTITRICDKCGKEEVYDREASTHGLFNSHGKWYDLDKKCSNVYNKLYDELFAEVEAKLDAWLK